MSTAEPTRAAEPARISEAPRSQSPAIGAAWVLRAAAVCAVGAAALGVLVAPGVRGNAPDDVVVATERAASAFSYLFYGLLLALLVRGVFEIVRARRVHPIGRAAVAIGTAICASMAAPAIRGPLPPVAKLALAFGAIVAVTPAAYSALRAPHTRAVGFVLWLFAIAAAARLAGWECGELASHPERSMPRLLQAREVLVTVGVLFEGLGQLVAAAWIGTRSRVVGQVSSSAAIAIAFLLTWGAAQGIHAHAWAWQAVMHTALADATTVAAPFGAVAAFLVCAAIALALAAILQPGQVVAVTSALALALVSRGAFDAPLRALAAVAGAIWIAVATSDERAMWQGLVASPAPKGSVSPRSPSPKAPAAPKPGDDAPGAP